MMRIFFDTSVLVAALIEDHPKHLNTFPWLAKAKAQDYDFFVSSHTLAELYAVLSTLPVKPRISPGVAWRLIHENIEKAANIISLSPKDYRTLIKRAAVLDLSGGIIYDALIIKAAEKAQADKILTLNISHFQKIWPGDPSVLVNP